ncbi:MAG TPA: VWA domain-containing protein [Acidobacteriota bacterium]|nr:VWA domain-containing protein [Acidobacteriota bacterium]
MNLTHPWILWLIPVFLAAEVLIFTKIRARTVPLATLSFVSPHKTWRTMLARFGELAAIVAGLFLLAAAANPWQIETERQTLPSGVSIMVALDVSGSMAAEDFKPLNRLAVAKDVLHDFIVRRSADRIGLILFAGGSVSRSPLTLQHAPLLKTLEHVEMGKLPEGTAIGTAIMSAINRLGQPDPQGKHGDRILVLITDGRNNAGEIHPYDALTIAAQRKIKIYTIGVGSYGDVPFPYYTEDGTKTYRYEKADLDEVLLQKIADTTGGKYFRATDPKSLENLFDQINRLEKSDPQILETKTVQSHAASLIVPALGLLALQFLILCWFRRIP